MTEKIMKEEIHIEGKEGDLRQLKFDRKGWVNNIPTNDVFCLLRVMGSEPSENHHQRDQRNFIQQLIVLQ